MITLNLSHIYLSLSSVTPHIADNSIHFNSESPKQHSKLDNQNITDGIEENMSENKGKFSKSCKVKN